MPKLPVEEAEITKLGLVGDGHRDQVHHGGPDRAVCLYSLEVINALRIEGHPIFAGAAGENITVEGIEWSAVTPGSRWELGEGTVLEVTDFSTPCQNNAVWFIDGNILRMHQRRHPGWSRVYARVLSPGTIHRGDRVVQVEA